MKVLISADMEGTAGIAVWPQVVPPDLITYGSPAPAEYEASRRLMVQEVNAAIRGARAAGATEIIVNDSHDGMRNLIPAELDPDAWLITGNEKPLVMVCDVDQDVDALVFTGYHARAGTQNGVLAHSFTTWILDIWIGDTQVGEHGLNAAAAGHWNVPVVAVTGDEAAVLQTQELVGNNCAGAIVKYGRGRHSAKHMHPTKACDLIEAAVKDGVSRAADIPPFKPSFPATVTVRLDTAARADAMQKVPGTDRPAGDTVSYQARDGKHLMEHFLAMMAAA
ncbi:MAG: M55 family metallopeptidase [Thermomicrobiaceae bacterium]